MTTITASEKVSAVQPIKPLIVQKIERNGYDYFNIEIIDGELRSIVARLSTDDICMEHGNAKDLAMRIVDCVNFCAGVDLDRLKVDCDKPDLTLADIIRDGDALADETLKDEREIENLKSQVAQFLKECKL